MKGVIGIKSAVVSGGEFKNFYSVQVFTDDEAGRLDAEQRLYQKILEMFVVSWWSQMREEAAEKERGADDIPETPDPERAKEMVDLYFEVMGDNGEFLDTGEDDIEVTLPDPENVST